MKNLLFWGALAASLALTGCENNAASYEIDNDKNHSISLLREQSIAWVGDVQQRFVVSRFPVCQRRFTVDPSGPKMKRIEIYEVRPRLYAAQQGDTWYALTTEDCRVQKFDQPPPVIPPGRLVGAFQKKDGDLIFKPVEASAPAAAEQSAPAN